MELDLYEDQIFENMDIDLDRSMLRGCVLRHCRLIYSGAIPAQVADCTLDDCQIHFTGPIANGLQFLQFINGQPGGQDQVSAIVDFIVSGSATLPANRFS
ncbi:hypothetical protein NKJ51_12315 [Mesorhizobium sp. M0134]|uniref:hypothetical protein n=1 Tax=Mesorhizobium sp. M0134 TaxID=2956889 RepID=UPI00333C97EE